MGNNAPVNVKLEEPTINFDFLQYLLMKAEQQEKQDWASLSLSLSSAMRDIEDEPVLYSMSDIRVVFA